MDFIQFIDEDGSQLFVSPNQIVSVDPPDSKCPIHHRNCCVTVTNGAHFILALPAWTVVAVLVDLAPGFGHVTIDGWAPAQEANVGPVDVPLAGAAFDQGVGAAPLDELEADEDAPPDEAPFDEAPDAVAIIINGGFFRDHSG